MKDLLYSAKYLAEDMASMILFFIVLEVGHNVLLAVALGMALGVGQVIWYLAQRRRMAPMTLLSVALVIVAGTATFLTHDPRFVMIKPSVISVVIGVFMLKRGWMTRYLPQIAQEMVPDVAVVFGYIWAGLEFFTAALNVVVALTFDPLKWATTMAIFGPVSMVGLFLFQFSIMRVIGERRHARMASQTPAAAT